MIRLLTATLLGTSLAAAPQDPKTATMQLPGALEVTGTMLADIDGDKQMDLVIACHNPSTGKRSLRMHVRQTRGVAFKSVPSRQPLELKDDVVAFTFCDCASAPGAELILLTPEIVFAVLTGKNGEPSYQPLARHQLVWPAADRDRVVPLANAAIDFDGDGRTDLLLPRPNGWSVLFQDRKGDKATFQRDAKTTLPRWQDTIDKAVRGRGISGNGNGFKLRISGGKPTDIAGMLVRAATRTPKCQAVDLDGDGKLDLVAHRNGTMYAAMQTKAGTLTMKEQPLPLSENRLKVIDPAFDVQWLDVNADRRADLLLTTSAQRDGAVEARVDLFLANTEGQWSDKPSKRLRMQTMAHPPQVVDATGDGKKNLVCVTLRTSAMAKLTGGGSDSFDAQVSIYGTSDGLFATPSLLSRAMPLATDSELKSPFLLVRPGRRGRAGDVLMIIDGHLERRFMNAKNNTLKLASPDARTPIPAGARLLLCDAVGDNLLLITGSEVRHLRFRR
ncbi:MAG: hypothetical protein ACI89X_003098 [Planctomycetota bacterium]|jgi:hypothetical protein